MPAPAFIVTAIRPQIPNSLSSSQHLAPRRLQISATPRRIRHHIRCEVEDPTTSTTTTTSSSTPADENPATSSSSNFSAPSIDTEVFSNFVDSATAKVDTWVQQLQDIDTDEVLLDAKEASMGLVDNLLAGDWLNRGELYGLLQIVFVVFLLRGASFLDAIVSFTAGPLLLAVGAFISGKSIFDLGRKQLSIWPAPVPDAQLSTDGLYQYVRHPIYAGLILASTGFAVATDSPAKIAITVAMAVFLSRKIEVEEEFLKDAYPEYDQYCENVPFKIIPKVF